MPVLGGLLLGLFSGLAEWFAIYLTKKLALATAAVLTFAALTVALYGVIGGLLAGLSLAFPAGGSPVSVGVWLMIPDDGPLCISTIVGIDTAVALYRWNLENLRLAVSVT